MLMENCVTTNTFLKEILLPPTLKSPFNVFTGWNDDINKAGYIPGKIPTTNGVSNSGIMIFGCKSILNDRSCPDNLFNQGKCKICKQRLPVELPPSKSIPTLQEIDRSVLFFWHPLTFLMPISFARKAERAVERFM